MESAVHVDLQHKPQVAHSIVHGVNIRVCGHGGCTQDTLLPGSIGCCLRGGTGRVIERGCEGVERTAGKVVSKSISELIQHVQRLAHQRRCTERPHCAGHRVPLQLYDAHPEDRGVLGHTLLELTRGASKNCAHRIADGTVHVGQQRSHPTNFAKRRGLHGIQQVVGHKLHDSSGVADCVTEDGRGFSLGKVSQRV